jgi:hypothetical protein
MYYTCFGALCLGSEQGSREPEKARRLLRGGGHLVRGPLAIVVDDVLHPERAILIGTSWNQRILVTIFLEKSDAETRLISARRASRSERRRYEEGE